MKILIINTDYSEFLEWLYEQTGWSAGAPLFSPN